ncbi:MAG: aminotransferase class I/II-fold pyridoxal phosphate-dependent enzyme [Cyanobacteria bacterium]|nr:aminotransferase class I/II-fold pyridoxal phosphate-dependent enzyme [Cyanobacteriota bacterium]MDA0866611.1 aminotransferase class I/II-fold pyridoxal phosphate-dependent enzyme [Cyanobacteriota bacterium]
MCSSPLQPTEAPLLSALALAAQWQHVSLHTPGHKGGTGASQGLIDVLGHLALVADLPEIPGLDNLFAPEGPIKAAQTLAAMAFGAEETGFLANGSTSGIEAAILATCGPGDRILVPRNVHQSVLSGLVLSGASPIYLNPTYSADWGLALGVTAEAIATALATYPEIKAVVVVSPTYEGICSDIAAIAASVHRHDAILLVDEAHGPHLHFHPDLPQDAIAAGADLAIQSTHKVLSALTQAAMVHVQGTRINRERLRRALTMTQSSSPNYLLLASLDAARHQMALDGSALLTQTLKLVDMVRSRCQDFSPIRTLSAAAVAALPGGFVLDPTRLTVDVSPLGITGFTADEYLHHQHRVTVELPTLTSLTSIFSIGNTTADGAQLTAALRSLVDQADTLEPFTHQRLSNLIQPLPDLSQPPMGPRDAFFAPQRAVAIPAAIGQLSAVALCPYPPGIPVVLPGEVITPGAIAHLQTVHQAGGTITGLADPALATLQIVAQP